MNRILANPCPQGYEKERLEILRPYLEKLDVVLDIHSVSTPITGTLGICHEKDQACAEEVLGVETLLIDEKFNDSGALTTLITSRGGVALGLECGMHQDKNAVDEARYAILRLLQYTKNTPNLGIPPSTKPRSIFKFSEEIIPKSLNFHYKENYQNFAPIQA